MIDVFIVHHKDVFRRSTNSAQWPVKITMKKYFVHPHPRNDGDNTTFCAEKTCHNNEEQMKQMTGVKEDIEKTRVYDDAYYKGHYGVKAYMEGGGNTRSSNQC